MSKYTDSPYENIPFELGNKYTMGGKIPVFDMWFDGTKKDRVC